jgi:hypothetical protein
LPLFVKSSHVLEQKSSIVEHVTLLAVNLDVVELSGSAEDALFLATHALYYASPVIDVSALELERGMGL